MIEQGKYKARAVEVEFGTSDNGNDQVGVAFEILDEGPEQGQTITWYGYFSDAAKKFAFKGLRTCGWQGDDLSALTAEDLPDEVQIVVEHEEYNGKTSAKVKWVNKPGGVAMANKMSDEQKKAFAARMKGDAIASKTGASSSAKPAAPAKRAPPPKKPAVGPDGDPGFTDDDIPF